MNKYNVIIEARTWDDKIISKVVDAKNITENTLIEMIKSYNKAGFTIYIEEVDNGKNEI